MSRLARHPLVLATMLLLAVAATAPAAQEIPLQAYGRLPTVSSMAVSPAGDRIAFRRVENGMDAVFVVDRSSGDVLGAVDGSATRIRSLSFLDQDRLVLYAAESEHFRDVGRKLDVSGSFVYDLRTNTLSRLLENSRYLYPLQSGVGWIVGHDPERDAVFMPAFVGELNGPPATYGLLEVTMDDPNGRLITRGNSNTVDWLVDGKGRLLAEEEVDDGVRRIWDRRGDKRELIHESGPGKPAYSIVGRGEAPDAIIVSARLPEAEFSAFFRMDLDDGSVGEPLFQRQDASVQKALVDSSRQVYGVAYSGFLPRYEFFDPALTQRVQAIQAGLKSTAAYLEDWSPDFRFLLFRLSGGWTSGAYVMVGPDSPTPRLLMNIREDIPRAAVAPTAIIEYAARDELVIPALLTVRDDVRTAGKVPLIVLPHGGPEAYDRYEFDWLAQYFANHGIAVLQPQFRGSSGFGVTLRAAGAEQWGRAMSTDLDDGVAHLVEEGLADPERVCMVGLSYGGYAALAAGAFSPFDYKCLASVGGVSDLPRMLESEEQLYGRDSNVSRYWRDQLGIQGKSRNALDPISPVNFADRFQAPVLLVHGVEDAVVPLDQSLRMERALRRADKPVTLVRLDGEDHYLSGQETRIAALSAVAEFIEKNL